MQRKSFRQRLSQWWHDSIFVAAMQTTRTFGNTALNLMKKTWPPGSANSHSPSVFARPQNNVRQFPTQKTVRTIGFERKRRRTPRRKRSVQAKKGQFSPATVLPFDPMGKKAARGASFNDLGQDECGTDDYLSTVSGSAADDFQRRIYATVALVRLRERVYLGLVGSKYPLYGRARIRKLRY